MNAVPRNPRVAYFPQSYLTDMFRFFERHQDQIEVVTYADFDWDDDFDYSSGYPEEKRRWLTSLKNGEKDKSKAYVLVQYDIDSKPERTMDLLRHEAHKTVPANITCFHKRVDRKHLKQTGNLKHTEYEIDIDLLKELERDGFLIAYHSNCYERSQYNKELAQIILSEDITELNEDFNIQFYTAHGGVPCKDGINNRDIAPGEELASRVRWVHNGATPFFNKQFSDGGHNSPLRDPVGRDIRDFVSSFLPGGRYRILCHPQYYAVDHGISKRYAGTEWYDELVADSNSGKEIDHWRNVHLCNFPNANNEDSRIVRANDSRRERIRQMLSSIKDRFS